MSGVLILIKRETGDFESLFTNTYSIPYQSSITRVPRGDTEHRE